MRFSQSHTNDSPKFDRYTRARKLHCERLEDRRLLAVVTVDTNQDVVDFNDGVTSLREAIFATNTVPGTDEIVFDFGHDGPETILLTQGELVITDSLTITGPGAELLTIDASGNDPTPELNNGDGSRVFGINDGNLETFIDVEIAGVTLTGGDDSYTGGAILTGETLSLHAVVITDNSAVWGGGIFSGRLIDGPIGTTDQRASVLITDSQISNTRSFGVSV